MNDSSFTSASLLSRIKHNDPSAWNRFVDLYGPLIFTWAKRYGFASEDAADIVQEVLASVARSIRTYHVQDSRSSFRAWLWTVTRNKLHDTYRQNEGRLEPVGGTNIWKLLEQIPEVWSDDANESTKSETQNLMHRCLEIIRSDFEEKTWKSFWNSVVLDKDTQSISEELGITTNTVRKYKSRVLRRLRQELGDLEE